MNSREPGVQPPTPYNDLNRVLRELAEEVESLLGKDLIGIYLQGSFAVGDFDLHSDVDFIAVIERELSVDRVTGLQDVHGRIHELNNRWAKHLEGSYFPRATVRTAPRRGDQLWYLNNGARTLIRSDHCIAPGALHRARAGHCANWPAAGDAHRSHLSGIAPTRDL